MFYVMLLGWLFTNIWIFGFGPGLTEIARITIKGWSRILVLGILGSGLAYIAYYDALQVLPASQLGVFLNIEPLVTTLLAALIAQRADHLDCFIGRRDHYHGHLSCQSIDESLPSIKERRISFSDFKRIPFNDSRLIPKRIPPRASR